MLSWVSSSASFCMPLRSHRKRHLRHLLPSQSKTLSVRQTPMPLRKVEDVVQAEVDAAVALKGVVAVLVAVAGEHKAEDAERESNRHLLPLPISEYALLLAFPSLHYGSAQLARIDLKKFLFQGPYRECVSPSVRLQSMVRGFRGTRGHHRRLWDRQVACRRPSHCGGEFSSANRPSSDCSRAASASSSTTHSFGKSR